MLNLLKKYLPMEQNNHDEKYLYQEDEDFMVDHKVAFLNKPTVLANSIIAVIILLTLICLIWAYFGKISQVTVGEGKVIPYTEDKIIQSLDGGIVAELPLHEGQIVKKNQVLIRLDDTRYKADFSETYSKYLTLLAITSRLHAEIFKDPKIHFPFFLAKEGPSLVQNEEKLFETRRKDLNEEIALLQKSFEIANVQLAAYQPLVKTGVVSKVEYINAELNVNNLKNNVLEKRNKFSEDAWEEYDKQVADLTITREQLKSLRDKMDRATLYSPVDGVVKKINIVTIGGVVEPGMDIMEIVPINDNLLVEVRIKPKDIAFIKKGQSATVKIAAYDYSIYGSLAGVVEFVSPDVIEEAKQVNGDSALYFIAKIRTAHNFLGNDKNKLPIIPGMTATVHIMTGENRVLNYFLKPLLKAKEEALRER